MDGQIDSSAELQYKGPCFYPQTQKVTSEVYSKSFKTGKLISETQSVKNKRTPLLLWIRH